MNIDWDPNKARANSANHGVLFSDAEAELYDPNGITRENDRAEGEQRFVTLARICHRFPISAGVCCE